MRPSACEQQTTSVARQLAVADDDHLRRFVDGDGARHIQAGARAETRRQPTLRGVARAVGRRNARALLLLAFARSLLGELPKTSAFARSYIARRRRRSGCARCC